MLTSIDTFSCLGSLEVTHPTVVREFPGSIPDSNKDFYVCFFVLLLLCFSFFVQTLFVMQFAILFAIFIHLVYLTYCKIKSKNQKPYFCNLNSLLL